MRIKSYFAASVQAAIAMARKEFGDAITLITSHVAGPDARHLGQYEVVFAVEEPKEAAAKAAVATETQPEPPSFNEFQQLLLQAVQVKPPVAVELPEKLECIRTALIGLGLDSATTSAVMTLIQKSLPVTTALATSVADESITGPPKEFAPVVSIESRRFPHLSAAELSFISAVSDSPGTATVSNR